MGGREGGRDEDEEGGRGGGGGVTIVQPDRRESKAHQQDSVRHSNSANLSPFNRRDSALKK